ncbi:MFS transporter [Chloroflexota bacterium]
MLINDKRPKIFYGWWIVGSSALITLYIAGVIHFGFTAVIEPIANEFGWSYTQISFAASIRGLEVSLLAPLIGFLVDRWGPRRLVLAGSILIGLGLLILSRVNTLSMFYVAFIVIATGMSACSTTALNTAVANWFRKKAALAVGIVASGFGLGGLLVPLVTWLTDTFEWRTAMFSLGLGMLIIIMPLTLIIRHKPEQYGYLPDGNANNAVKEGASQTFTASAETNIPARQALRSRAFWYISLAAMCHVFVGGAIVTHVMPYLSSVNIIRSTSSLVALLMPVVSVCGRLSVGWLGDTFGERRVYALGLTLVSVGSLLFSYVSSDSIWLLVPFIIIFSFGWGINATSRMSIIRHYFGRSSFGTILGFSSGIMMVGSITGTPLAGWVFDTWGSYQGAWLAYTAVTLTGMILVSTMSSPK